MKLEVLTERSTNGRPKGNIVLLHGACMGAWCWSDNFLPWFAGQGFDTHAVSLRNHGNSERRGSLRFTSIKSYVEDLRQVVGGLEGPVHLIGHSMGGLTVQHYLADPAPQVGKVVLLCSAVPHTDLSIIFRLLRDFPLDFLRANFLMSWKPVFQDARNARKVMLSEAFPEGRLGAVMSRMQDESFLVFLQILGLSRPDTAKVRRPLMIIGGEKDYLIAEKATRRMALTYGVDPLIVKDGPHNLMMEEGWQDIAGKIVSFLED
jgi:pimeloyl-ACP methyl ester carboxylesterase